MVSLTRQEEWFTHPASISSSYMTASGRMRSETLDTTIATQSSSNATLGRVAQPGRTNVFKIGEQYGNIQDPVSVLARFFFHQLPHFPGGVARPGNVALS